MCVCVHTRHFNMPGALHLYFPLLLSIEHIVFSSFEILKNKRCQIHSDLNSKNDYVRAMIFLKSKQIASQVSLKHIGILI